jgi:methionyl-tRNA synthetase
MELSQLGNTYFDAKKPWTKGMDPSTTLSCCVECIKNLALLASPIIPDIAQKIWEMIGFTSELAKQNWDIVRKTPVEPNKTLPTPQLLFRKIEDTEIEEQISKLGKKMTTSLPQPTKINFEDFQKIELKVALVLEAEKVPKAKKLLKLLLDLGTEKRTVVSGIALAYEPETLIGRKVILVANLAPATIMGIESQGMILAASNETGLELPRIDHLPPGSRVS